MCVPREPSARTLATQAALIVSLLSAAAHVGRGALLLHDEGGSDWTRESFHPSSHAGALQDDEGHPYGAWDALAFAQVAHSSE